MSSNIPTVCPDPDCLKAIKNRVCVGCGNKFGRHNEVERRKKPRFFPAFSRDEITSLRSRSKFEWPHKNHSR